ncbi:MAG TPA: hypothetical protein VGB15_17520, partial [Longimicrobium sp.]
EVCGTTLRYWCRVHSKTIGWLDSPECPSCAAEAAPRAPRPTPPRAPTRAPTPPPTRAPAPPPAAPRAPERPPAPPPSPPSWRTRVTARRPAPPPGWTGEPAPSPVPRRDPRDVLREGAEDIGPYVRTGAGVAFRLFRSLLAVIRNVIGWGLIGTLLAAGVAYYENADMVWFAMFGAMVGGGIGLLFGLIRAIRILFAQPERRPR